MPEKPGSAGRRPPSARQIETMEVATPGLTNVQIAERVPVTGHAIQLDLPSGHRELCVANRTGTAALAYPTLQRDERS